MRTFVFLLLLLLRVGAEEFAVHEWGTFTAVSGSDGVLLGGLELEEHPLPRFVLSHAGFAPANKGWNRPVAGVTIKMETPVLYFYSAEPLPSVRVEVGFRGGSISQWYPERVGGERLPPVPQDPEQLRRLPPIDFARGFSGSAVWEVEVLPRETSVASSVPREWETREWPHARVASANRVRGPKGEIEGFIFYRGPGNFALPLRVRAAADGSITLSNSGNGPIPGAIVYERSPAGSARWLATSVLEPRASRTLARVVRQRTPIEVPLRAQLVAAGLTVAEAEALLATWRESYFERPGARVFWIVPRAFTDAVLPIAITPRPAKLERVLVGRTELLTPAFEAELRGAFATDGGARWKDGRYFRAYRERAHLLAGGGAVGVAQAGAAP